MKHRHSPCVRVYIKDGERARRILHGQGLIIPDLRIRREGDSLVIPVVDALKAVEVLKWHDINAEYCEGEFYEVGRSIGKPGIEVSYVVIGSVAIVNPRRGVEDLGYYISQAKKMIEELKPVKSVYLKQGTHGEYRVPRLVHLAGERNTVTIHKEYGIRFKVDLSKVFFNPRLSFEHRRVAEQVDRGERVLDMFTGVGGFAIHIAVLNEAKVLAVDINHYAAAYAAINVGLNRRMLRGHVAVLRADAMMLPQIHHPVFDRVIMNNPTMASRFSSVACKMLAGSGTIHYYTLTISKLEAQEEATSSFSSCGVVRILDARRVLEYSPEQAVYVVDIEVGG